MALVKCKNCGKEGISPNAPICPACGEPEPGNYPVSRLKISRRSSIFGTWQAIHVYINNEHVGDVNNGKTIYLDILPGKKSLSFRSLMVPSVETDFTAIDKQEHYFELTFSPYPTLVKQSVKSM